MIGNKLIMAVLFLSVVLLQLACSYVESVAASVDESASTEFHPMVAFQCGYRNRYMDKQGNWVSDQDRYATCLTGKLDILKYCRKAYPNLEVTNILEETHFHKVTEWCKEEGSPCKWTHTVRPYRCIVGEFQSEALLVPQGCRFGHVDDRKVCEDFKHWEDTSHQECDKRNGGMDLKSFALLAPCGLDMYSGVEFVCCPKGNGAAPKVEGGEEGAKKKADLNVRAKVEEKDDEDDDDSDEDDDAYDDDDDDDSDEEDDKNAIVSDGKNAEDPYFRVADPDNEHEMYKSAMKRVEDKHREKVAKVMKEWSELENRYQEMKTKDPNQADKFKSEMTARFQKTVAALEEENEEEKRQLDEVHQERVQAALNERKRETIKAYRDALALSMDSIQPQKVLKTLQAYIRSEEKDRTHCLNRYRHLLKSDPDAAEGWRAELLRKLRDIDLRINGTIAMLHDLPKLEEKVKPVIVEFWKTYRKENSPSVRDESVIGIGGQELNTKLLNELKATYERERDEEPKLAKEMPVSAKVDAVADTEDEDSESQEDEHEGQHVDAAGEFPANAKRAQSFHETEVKHHEMVLESGANHTLLILGVAGAVLLLTVIIGVVLVRRRPTTYDSVPTVDACSPEEKHVSAMQINGYENPTYSFFTEKA